jgi:hypothetical protein
MTVRSTKAVTFGAVVALVGALLIWGALAPLTERRDADGYYMSDALMVDRPSHAVVSGDIGILRGRYETVTESSVVLALVAEPDDVRMKGVASGSEELFMGIAPSSDVEEYLDGIAHDEITDWEADRASIRGVEYTTYEGTGTPDPPGAETIWVESVAGTGLQTLDWTIESGDWTAVIMNADGSSGVSAEVAFGAAPDDVVAIAWVTFSIGIAALIVGGLLLYRGFRPRVRDSTTSPGEARTGQTS